MCAVANKTDKTEEYTLRQDSKSPNLLEMYAVVDKTAKRNEKNRWNH